MRSEGALARTRKGRSADWISLSGLALLFAVEAWAAGSVEQQLEQVYERRRHVRYVFGGCDDQRMDCSCFVQKTFSESFSTQIPRSTLGQVRFFEGDLLDRLRSTRYLSSETLCPGDLIYTYRGDQWEKGARHVAIYAGGGEILHAARGVGVAVQPLRVLGHHRLRGVVRLFECRGSGGSRGAGSTGPKRPPPPPTGTAKQAANLLRETVHGLFLAWQHGQKASFDRHFAPGALIWLKQTGPGGDVMADREETFERLKGRVWRYWIRSLQVRGRSAFVELASELPCRAPRDPGCGRQIQTFVWRQGQDGEWRIAQHEIGSAQ